MHPNEKLAVLTALQKQIKKELNRARKEVERGLSDGFAESGADRARLMLDGTEVGTVSLKIDRTGWRVTDAEAFEGFLIDNGGARVRYALKPYCEQEVVALLQKERPDMFDTIIEPLDEFTRTFRRVGDVMAVADTDVAVPGIEPAPPTVKGVMVRGCDPRDVAPIVSRIGGLDAVMALEDGHDD